MNRNVKYIIADRVANSEMSGWLHDAAVRIEENKVADVVPVANLPDDIDENAEVLRLGDVSLIPGLIDAHCHMHCSATSDAQKLALEEKDDIQRLTMRAVSAMRKAVLAGTTTIRDIGSRNEVAFPIKQAIKDGAISRPRLLAAGTPITITAGHCCSSELKPIPPTKSQKPSATKSDKARTRSRSCPLAVCLRRLPTRACRNIPRKL